MFFLFCDNKEVKGYMFIKRYIKTTISEKVDQMYIKKADQYGIFDLNYLTHDYNRVWTQEYHLANGFYGISTILKEYAKIEQSKIIKVPIEHGINVHEDAINPYEIGLSIDKIITLSEYRKHIIEKLSNKKAIAIGPYIAYAKSYYEKEILTEMHKKNGRTLLIFPTHSTKTIDTCYDADTFLNQIRKIRKQFDTVLVCLYWKDIVRGIHKYYQKEGYNVVCAGHIYDVNFLKRLRSIFELTDAVIFNQTGTGLGYAMQLQKPCYIYYQELKFYSKSSTAYLEQKYASEHYKLVKAFNIPNFYITEEQLEICRYVYGVGQTKTPEQLRELLLSCVK